VLVVEGDAQAQLGRRGHLLGKIAMCHCLRPLQMIYLPFSIGHPMLIYTLI
jgi:hypothetical protein